MPVLLEKVRGWSSADVGLALAVLSGPAALLSPLGGRLSDQFGRRAPAVAGNLLLALSAVPLVLDPRLDSAALLVLLGLMGCGIGLSVASLQTSAVEAVPAQDAGSAAGMFSTSRYLGSIAGTIVLAALLAPHASAFRPIFLMVLVAGALSVVAAAALPGRVPPRREPEEQALAGAGVG
jgi:DHA2 family methylenomycin A resistance protein-like MFS transporter